MSAFPSQLPDVGQGRRRQMPGIPGVAAPPPLESPGIAVVPVVETPGARMARELADSLGITAQLAFTARGLAQDTIAARERAEVEARRKEAERERLDREAKALHEGNAAAAARVDFQKLKNDILSGKLATPEGETPESFVSSLIASRTEGQPSVYAEAYKRTIEPGLLDSVYTRIGDIEKQNVKQDVQLLSERAIAASDSATIAESVAEAKRVDPTLTDIDALRAVAAPALKSAAETGDETRFRAAMDALGDRLPAERRFYQSVYDAKKAEEKQAREGEATRDIFSLVLNNDFTAAIDRVSGVAGLIDDQTRLKLTDLIHARYQDRTLDAWHSLIVTGAKTPEEVEAMAKEAAAIPVGQLGHIDGSAAKQFIIDAKKARQTKLDEQQVALVLAGAPGTLNKSQHADALVNMLGPDGLGYLDQTNRIVNPEALGSAILQTRILPTPIAQTMLNQLMSSDPAEVAAAGQAVGIIGGSSRLFADLIDQTPESMRPAVTEALDAFRGGKFASEKDRLAAAERLRNALAANREKRPASSQTIAEVRRSLGDNYDTTVADQVIEEARRGLAHTEDAILGFDWFDPDPSLDVQQVGQDIHSFARDAYLDRYSQIQGSLPPAKADEIAKKYALGRVKNAVDYVRWNGELRPVLIEKGANGLRMPEAIRWGSGFEDEAKADLKEKRPDLDPDYLTPVPLLDPVVRDGENIESVMGWQFVDGNNQLVTYTHEGKEVRFVFRPTDKTAKANAEYRAMLDKKEQGFTPYQKPPQIPDAFPFIR